MAAYHRRRNAATLTVVMFHRVLPADRLVGADPEYTVSADLFAACLRFFRQHYNVVDLAEVLAARSSRRRLKERALLITFDDGWADNACVALPLLRQEGLPATVFVATDAVADPSPCWWQETLLRPLREGHVSYEALWRLLPGPSAPIPAGPDRELRLLLRFHDCDAAARARALAPFVDTAAQRHMMTLDMVRRLPSDGIAVGAHGASHMPLSFLPSPFADLARARTALAGLWNDGAGRPQTLACPHGRWSAEVAQAARAVGFQLIFTSEPWLNATVDGALSGDVLGRVDIPAHQIVAADGSLSPDRLATWLFTRPQRPPGITAASFPGRLAAAQQEAS
ncbi:peptidoglycan/xylan/chitin deacetylase (PgdA/CDA1 family) [Azospirillum canadense]|nr:peptidoglycan/xylan/chitin deacetylase (PgdA/CDA1 family) [Azospirillum canadense]